MTKTGELNVCCHYCRISQNRQRKKAVTYVKCSTCRKQYCARCLDRKVCLGIGVKKAMQPGWRCDCCKNDCCCTYKTCTRDHNHCFTYKRTLSRHSGPPLKWVKVKEEAPPASKKRPREEESKETKPKQKPTQKQPKKVGNKSKHIDDDTSSLEEETSCTSTSVSADSESTKSGTSSHSSNSSSSCSSCDSDSSSSSPPPTRRNIRKCLFPPTKDDVPISKQIKDIKITTRKDRSEAKEVSSGHLKKQSPVEIDEVCKSISLRKSSVLSRSAPAPSSLPEKMSSTRRASPLSSSCPPAKTSSSPTSSPRSFSEQSPSVSPRSDPKAVEPINDVSTPPLSATSPSQTTSTAASSPPRSSPPPIKFEIEDDEPLLDMPPEHAPMSSPSSIDEPALPSLQPLLERSSNLKESRDEPKQRNPETLRPVTRALLKKILKSQDGSFEPSEPNPEPSRKRPRLEPEISPEEVVVATVVEEPSPIRLQSNTHPHIHKSTPQDFRNILTSNNNNKPMEPHPIPPLLPSLYPPPHPSSHPSSHPTHPHPGQSYPSSRSSYLHASNSLLISSNNLQWGIQSWIPGPSPNHPLPQKPQVHPSRSLPTPCAPPRAPIPRSQSAGPASFSRGGQNALPPLDALLQSQSYGRVNPAKFPIQLPNSGYPIDPRKAKQICIEKLSLGEKENSPNFVWFS